MTLLQLGEAATEEFLDGNFPEWIGEAYGASGLGVSGTMLFIVFTVAVGLLNWSESFRVPAVWLALTTPLVAATLPVPIVWRLIGIITTAVAMLFVGLWVYWQRT